MTHLPPLSRRPLLARLPRATWLLLGLYVALAALYAAVTPLFEKPDENWHFAFAMYLAETGRLPVQRLEGRDHLAEQEASQPPLYYALLAGGLKLAGLDELRAGFEALTEPNPYYGGRAGAWRDNANQFVHAPCEGACRRTATAAYVGRALSILCGALALLAAAVALHLAFPARPALGVVTVGLIAFTPQFLHIASSVSNDALTVALVNGAFALLLAWQRQPASARRAVALGTVAGLAALAKLSGLTVVATAGLALLLTGGLPGRLRLRQLALFTGAVLAVSGWWFVRNLLLYGEPTGTVLHLQVYGVRAEPLRASTLLAEWRAVANSFWASFGWGGLNPSDALYAAARGLALLLALLGGVEVLRRWRAWGTPQRLLVGSALFHALLVGALLFRWMRLTVAPLGRLLFPALLPVALGLALGGLSLVPRRWQRPAAALWLGGWAGVALALLLLLVRPAYRPALAPATLPPTATPLGVRFGEHVVLEGVEAPGGPLAPGSAVPVTLFWRSDAPLDENLSVALKLFGRDGELLAESNSFPDGGRAPTRAWQPGRLVADRVTLLLPPDVEAPVLARAEVDLFRRDATLSRLPATVGGQPVQPVRPFQLLVRAVPPAPPFAFRFRPTVERVALREGAVEVALWWEVGQPLGGDFQAFFHLAPSPEAPPVQTADFAPLGGDLPTGHWLPGDRLPDHAALPLPADRPPGDYQLLLGLYDLKTGQRVAGEGAQDVWVLARLHWDGQRWALDPSAATR